MLLQDIQQGLRQLRKGPGFTFVAVLTLALGIGANTAIFSVVYAVLLRPLPFRNPVRIVAVKPTEPNRHDDIGVSYPAFLDWRSRSHAFEGLSAFRTEDFTLTGRGEPIHVTGGVVSANTFPLLGVSPVVGRDFTPNEDSPTSTGLPVILSRSFWQERFHSDPNISGQSLTLSGQVFTVVGVMPEGFQFPVQSSPVNLWTTIALDARSSNGNPPMTAQRGISYLDVIARLKPDAKIAQAQSEMAAIQDSLNHQYPENRPKGIVLIQIRSLPGVQAASAVFPLPLSASDVKTSYEVENRPAKQADLAVTTLHLADDDYFHALGIPLLSGREFNSQDDLSGAAPVVVISQALARQAFPGVDPVGKRIRPDIASGPGDAPMRLIVGVVGDVHAEGLASSPIPESYVPYAQLPFSPMAVVARTVVDPESMVPTLTRTVQSIDKDLPLLHTRTLDQYVAESVGDTRFETVLLGVFATLAVVLTCVGLYGVISYLVAQQTREMGIRLALGADRDAILRMVVGSGLWLSGVGIAIGLASSLLLTRLIASLLYDVSPSDPLTFCAVPATLVVMATVASYIPARRASKVDPIVALRYE